MNIRLLQSVALVFMATALSGCSPSSMDEQGANRLITNALGLAEQGDYAAARDSVFSALDIYHRLGQEIHSADAERILGGFDEANGAFDSALTHYALALQHYRGQAERESARAMIMSIVNVHLEMGDVKGAFAQCEEALRLAGVVGDREGMLKYSRALLPILRALGRTDDYNSLWKELMDAADSSGNAAARIDLRDEAGINALSKEDAAQAVKLFSEALQETEHGGDSLTSIRVRLHLAQAFDAAGNLPEAMTTYTVALKESDGFSNGRSIREAILFHVGNTLLRLHRLEDARRFYEAAVASSTERNDVQAKMYALLQVAQCELQRHPDSSRVLAQSALNLLQNGSPPAMSSYAYGTLGLANLKLGNPAEALNDFRQAIESTELIVAHRGEDNLYVECERAAVGSGLVPWHDEAIDLLLRLGRRDEALEYALRKNHALLLADLGSMDLSTSHDDLDRLLSQWHAVRTRLVGEESLLAQALAIPSRHAEAAPNIWSRLQKDRIVAREISAAMIAARPELKPFVEIPTAAAGSFQQRLPAGSALLLYGTTSRLLYVFIVSREAINAPVAAIDRPVLANQCAAYAGNLEMLATAIDSQATTKKEKTDLKTEVGNASLFDLFIRPVERALIGSRIVLIAPPEQIPFIPIHALRKGPPAGTSLIERWPVAYVIPSLLTGDMDPGPAVKDIVAFGNPGHTGRDVDYELRDIRVNFKDARFYMNAQAIPSLLYKEHADLLHAGLDVHWDPSCPENSEIILPDPRTEVLKGIPVGDLLRLPAFPTMVLYNCSANPAVSTTRFCTIPLGSGTRTFIVNGLATGRKADKVFAEAFYNSLQDGLPASDAYRAATLDILRQREVTIPRWASYMLWRK